MATSTQDQSRSDQAREQASQASGQAQEKAQQVAGQAKEQAQQAAGQAKGQARSQVDQRSTQAGEQVTAQANDLRTVAEKLREEGKEGPAKVAEQAADRAQRVGSYLTDSDADRILNDIEDIARQRPWAVVAGGLALGFAASRFLKASSTDRYNASRGQLPRSGETGGYDRSAAAGTGYTLGAGAGTAPAEGTAGGRFEREDLETETERVRGAATGPGAGAPGRPAGPAPTTGGPPTSTGAL